MAFWEQLARLRPNFRRAAALRAAGEEPRLAIVTCIKNEGEDLVEWLCFHRHIGVSEFVIYDNLSTDATSRILAAVPFRDTIKVHRVREEAAQKVAFADAIRRYRHRLDWAAFIDGDEFIVPLGEKTIVERLAECEAMGLSGFGINWRVFGSSGHMERPPGLVTESFTRRAPDTLPYCRHVKSVVRMARARKMVTPHYITVAGDYRLDDGSKPDADFIGIVSRPSFEGGFAIHHYVTKSHAQCMRKIARGRPRAAKKGDKYRPPEYWEQRDRNEIEDARAAEVIAPIRDEVLKLRDAIGRD